MQSSSRGLKQDEIASADSFAAHMRAHGVAPEDVSCLVESYGRAAEHIAAGRIKPDDLVTFVMRDARARGMGSDIINAAMGWTQYVSASGE